MLAEPIKTFTHDCNKCTFLGNFTDYSHLNEGAFDLYYCMQFGTIPTVIARYGNEGSEYLSGLGFSHPALKEAEKRASKINLTLTY
jgi:hypothetical protein